MAVAKCPECGANAECSCLNLGLDDFFQYTLICKKCGYKEHKSEKSCPFCGQAQAEHSETSMQYQN